MTIPSVSTGWETLPTGASLVVSDLTVSYRGVTAVSGVTFEVAAGGCIAIVGANGAGKTSTLHGISGLVKTKRASSIRLDGKQLNGVQDPARRSRIGLGHVPENRHVFAGLSVAENLQLAFRHRADRSVAPWGHELALRLFPELNLMLPLKAGSLSGGQQQFLAIARALAGQPRVLMLDEPTNGLAPLLVDRVIDVIHELQSMGLTLLLVEQRLEVATSVATHVHIMSHGRVVQTVESNDPSIESYVERAYLS